MPSPQHRDGSTPPPPCRPTDPLFSDAAPRRRPAAVSPDSGSAHTMTTDSPHVAYLAPSDPARPQPGRANDEEADRSENAVLTAYLFHLTAKGHRVLRHRVVADPVLASTDLGAEERRVGEERTDGQSRALD